MPASRSDAPDAPNSPQNKRSKRWKAPSTRTLHIQTSRTPPTQPPVRATPVGLGGGHPIHQSLRCRRSEQGLRAKRSRTRAFRIGFCPCGLSSVSGFHAAGLQFLTELFRFLGTSSVRRPRGKILFFS